jgi:diacylglycerol kinase
LGANAAGGPVTHRATTPFLASFRYATAGLFVFFATTRNARVQVCAGLTAIALAALLRISRVEWALLLLTIAAVLALEAVNSAIEAAVDLVTPEYHPLAKRAKDLAAGAVWLMALASIAIGGLLFLPRLAALATGNR